jgi:hypothetical protein
MELGIPVSTYGAHERAQSEGGRDYGPDEAQEYARHFGVSAEWLLTGHGSSGGQPITDENSEAKLKVVGYVGEAGRVHLYDLAPEKLDQVELLSPLTNALTVALELRSGAFGLLPKDWLLLYDNDRRRPMPFMYGMLCVVDYGAGQIVVELLRREAGAVTWAVPVKAMIPRG